jgi:hypothetical protein
LLASNGCTWIFFSLLQFCSTCTSQNLIAFACQFIFLCFCHSSSFSSKQAPAKEQTRDQARGLMGILINDNKSSHSNWFSRGLY